MDKEIRFIENEKMLCICHDSVQILYSHIPSGKPVTWTPHMSRAFLEIQTRGLMPVSSTLALTPESGPKKEKETVADKKRMEKIRKKRLDPIPEGTTVPIPRGNFPHHAVILFPEGVPASYGAFFMINCMVLYFMENIRFGSLL